MKLQNIKSIQQNKYNEILDYLKLDDGYWLEQDKWDLTKDIFIGKIVHEQKFITFNFENERLKNEIKYYLLYNFKEKIYTDRGIVRFNQPMQYMSKFFKCNSLIGVDIYNTKIKWSNFLIKYGINYNKETNLYYFGVISNLISFIKNFYDKREETEKDIWNLKNISGIKSSASQNRQTSRLNFENIPNYYRETVKRYLRTIITKKSISTCFNTIIFLNYFFNYFYNNGYQNGFIENLKREDIEKYTFSVMNERKGKNATETSKYVSYIRTFLEYIQMAQYDKAPKKEISFLIFQNDIPKRERLQDQLRRVKFIPEPILKQLDNNIMDLDRPQFLPIYILLRETGWRGTDILNLRYHNCLEQIWNNKEERYNYYLCGEITKTGIAQLKIPIRDKVAEMVQKSINKAKELSTEENNPKKYLFNTYEGKLKGKPLNKPSLLNTIQRLIEEKDIRDVNGELYHFRLHSLRHTRAKEYVEQGIGISVIQQILGHQSLQMTVHYATVTENTLYEKWKSTEDLDLFRVDTETHELQQVVLDSEDRENLIRYEYVKQNLDAVKVPFGVCFKPSKLPCKQQMNHCLTCASFCTTFENIPEYEEEIEKVKSQIDISNRCGRELWVEKNKQYLSILEQTLEKVKEHKLVHKNGKSREDS